MRAVAVSVHAPATRTQKDVYLGITVSCVPLADRRGTSRPSQTRPWPARRWLGGAAGCRSTPRCASRSVPSPTQRRCASRCGRHPPCSLPRASARARLLSRGAPQLAGSWAGRRTVHGNASARAVRCVQWHWMAVEAAIARGEDEEPAPRRQHCTAHLVGRRPVAAPKVGARARGAPQLEVASVLLAPVGIQIEEEVDPPHHFRLSVEREVCVHGQRAARQSLIKAAAVEGRVGDEAAHARDF